MDLPDPTLFFDMVWNSRADHTDVALVTRINSPILTRLLANLEPTSALDPETTLAVEKYTLSMSRRPENAVKAIIWITHSEEQGQRVGTRFITLAGGKAREDQPAPVNLV